MTCMHNTLAPFVTSICTIITTHPPTHTLLVAPSAAQLDRDNDGVISLDELHATVAECGAQLTRKQLADLLRKEGGCREKEPITPEAFRVGLGFRVEV